MKKATTKVAAKKPTGKAAPAKLAKTVTHQASAKVKAESKAKRASKPVKQVTLKPGQTAMVATFADEKERKYPVVVMTPQTTPNGKTGPYCAVLLPGKVTTQRPTGRKEEVMETRTNLQTGETKEVKCLKPVMATEIRDGLMPVWCRVVKGDERNGVGIVYQPNDNAPLYEAGMKIRFAGGTKQTPAKMMELLDAPVGR